MSIEQLTESYIVNLDAEGKKLYTAMRKAEDDWIMETGFQHFAYENRTHLLLATHERLPPLASLQQTRLDFQEWLSAKAIEEGKPKSVGVRSTALPVWLAGPNLRIPVDQTLPSELERIVHIKVRKQTAWRSAHLNKKEVLEILQSSLSKVDNVLENYERRGQKGLLNEAKKRRDAIFENLKEVRNVYEQNPKVVARIRSGEGTKFLMKRESDSFSSSIATIGLVLGTPETKVEFNTHKKNRQGSLTEICRIDPFVFYAS